MSEFAVQPGQVMGMMALAWVCFTQTLTTAFCHPHLFVWFFFFFSYLGYTSGRHQTSFYTLGFLGC